MGQLDGKIAVITGGGTGIGKAIAHAFSAEGAKSAIASRNNQNLETTAEELRASGATVLAVPTDVKDEAQVVALFDKTMQEFERVDILVNNSAAFDGGPLDEISLEAWQNVMDVNLTGVFLCTREAMKIMKRQGGGRIINIGSVSAQVPRANTGPYTTSKHGLVGLTRSTALEGRPFGISASCLHPGNVSAEWRVARNAESDQEAMMTPDDIARVALTMAAMPPYANVLESIVLPVEQLYVGRG